LRDWWIRRPQLEVPSVAWLTDKLREMYEAGHSRNELLALLRDMEFDLEDGKLTQKTDNALQILSELRAAQREVEILRDIRDEAEGAECEPREE
jgi:hypothetical protein